MIYHSRECELTPPHQKCDAKRPCTTCVNDHTGSECAYKPRQRPRPTATFQTLANKLSRPSGLFITFDSNESTPTLPPPLVPCERPSPPTARLPRELSPYADTQVGLGPSSDVLVVQNTHGAAECAPRSVGFSGSPVGPVSPLLTRSDSNESSFFLFPAPCERPSSPTAQIPWESPSRTYNQMGLGPLSGVSAVQDTHGTTERVPPLTGSSFTILPSIHFRTIPWPLRIPLSFIPPEHAQVSSVARSDLDMTLCVCFRFLEFHRSWGLTVIC